MALMEILGVVGALGSIFGKKNDSSKAIKQATAAQIAAQERAMKQYEDMMREAMRSNMASNIASAQTQYDLYRAVNAQNQAAQQPYQMARLSALQSLPQMQQLLGVDAYALPTTIKQTQLPEIDMAAQYQNMQNRLGLEGNAYRNAAIAAGADPLKLGYTGMPSVSMGGTDMGTGIAANVPEDQTIALRKLAPTQNLEYAIQSSPLYKWQLNEATRGLNNQLAAAGLSGSTYAQRELGRRSESLAAQERERQISNLQWLTNMGMGGQATAGTMTAPSIGTLGANQSNMMADMATALSQGTAGIGATQAQGALNLAAYKAQQPDPWGQLLGAAWMFGGGLSGNQGNSASAGNFINPYAQFANQQATGLMGMGRVY